MTPEGQTLHHRRRGVPCCEALGNILSRSRPPLPQLAGGRLSRTPLGSLQLRTRYDPKIKASALFDGPTDAPSSTTLADNGSFRATQRCIDRN